MVWLFQFFYWKMLKLEIKQFIRERNRKTIDRYEYIQYIDQAQAHLDRFRSKFSA